jgi:hypothetical protein
MQKRINRKQKIIVLDGEVARNLLEAFSLSLFSLLTFVLEEHVRYKMCSSDIPISNKKT